jgi:hypothetical protein
MGMSKYKRMLCLASSRKRGGCCVAGIVAEPQGRRYWLRPVGAYATGLSDIDCWIGTVGRSVQPLDVVRVPVTAPAPERHQKENWRIDPTAYWEYEKSITPNDATAVLHKLADATPHLWEIGMSTQAGCNDEVTVDRLNDIDCSLRLIHVPSLTLRVRPSARRAGELRVQGAFEYAGVPYALWITDRRIEDEYKVRGIGEYALGSAFLTISLSEPFGDAVHKLIAAVMPVGRAHQGGTP